MNYSIIILRVALAVILGGGIGLERQSKNRPAGFRTHILVCLGSATIMLLSELIFIKYHSAYGINPDPMRMGAQVISGIGFLGVGTIIINRRMQVRGLTTAASLWVCACMGLAIGTGFYIGAVVGFVCVLIINIALNQFEYMLLKISRYIELYVTFENYQSLISYKKMLETLELTVTKFDMVRPQDALGKRDIRGAAFIQLKLKNRKQHGEIFKKIGVYEGLLTFEEVT